ncbi:DUF1802 family protein [Oscillatoria acuminata]|uniref:Uncharacterized protein n=1 Tax=Oscillatoria acuminata PCC 6304 TaxID=56110 RepID=K9TMZ4_9CYAN|nr:DUF1802 family protein [Oscillatoria acuminata]AFY83521.1 protein of unknown function (DUF1802) [Oscillatoria acuminata PCC 6304]
MNQPVLISTALGLSPSDVEALIQGTIMAVVAENFLDPGQEFALYSQSDSGSQLLRDSPNHPTEVSETLKIVAIARCEGCQTLTEQNCLPNLSRLTGWNREDLQQILQDQGAIFLAHLRVYRLPGAIALTGHPPTPNAIGTPISLPVTIPVTDSVPVLSDRSFAYRRSQLEEFLIPLHPELDALQRAIAQLAHSQPTAQNLDDDLQQFLGFGDSVPFPSEDPDLTWISTIASVGNSQDDQGFAKLVREGLLKLGFSGPELLPDSLSAGEGFDFYCETPYLMVGQCKAKNPKTAIADNPAQLLTGAANHLGTERYERAIKWIIAAEELTVDALNVAIENQMNVIRPETLQSLVNLQAKYKGSVDLLKLKQCLRQDPYGWADDKVNSYIDKVKESIELRSGIIKLVKRHLENSRLELAGVEALHALYVSSHPHHFIPLKEMHEILIELSSPLTGYLGRIKGSDWHSDRFYYLRDLSR